MNKIGIKTAIRVLYGVLIFDKLACIPLTKSINIRELIATIIVAIAIEVAMYAIKRIFHVQHRGKRKEAENSAE